MDGVVLDSGRLWTHIIEDRRKKYSLDQAILQKADGYNLTTAEAITMVLKGMGIWSESLLRKMLDETDEMYIAGLGSMTSLEPGIPEILSMLKEKGIPLDNVSRFDGTKERVLLVLPAASLKESTLLFATEQGMIKTVLGTEFLTANRMVAATKLAEGDKLAQVRPVPGEDELVLSTSGGMVIKFPLAEVPELKKNSRGVRGMKLEDGDRLEHVYFAVFDKTMEYRGKEVALGRLKLSKRDGKGTKIRLDRS